jgi:hypothetical protein
MVYLTSSGVAGSTANVFLNTSNLIGIGTTTPSATLHVAGNIYASNAVTTTNVFATTTNTQALNVTSNMNFTGALATLANLYVPGNANIEYLSVSNLSVTGNLIITATNVQTTNALVINNAGTSTALKVTQYEPTIHTHNVAEFWDATTLAMVIDPEGNVAIHTVSSPGYALTVTDPANFETLYIRGKNGTPTLNVTGNITASNALTTTNVFADRYYGDGGLLSNITSFVQPLANLVVSNAVTTTNVFANTLTLVGTAGQTTLYVNNNVFVSDTLTKMIDNTSLAMYVGGGTITSVPTRAINTYSTSYPNFLASGSSQFYFNDSVNAVPLTSTAGAGVNFGNSVAFSADGNTALVGAPTASSGAGYAAVYRFTNGSWGSASPLTSTAGAGANFGWSVALSADGNTAIVGALYDS